MYCSYFSYCEDNKTRSVFCHGKPYEAEEMLKKLTSAAQAQMIKKETLDSLTAFLRADDIQQRHVFDEKSVSKPYWSNN